MEPSYEKNLPKIKELVPDAQSACLAWLNDCWQYGFRFKILEAFRSQDRQNALYAQGRTKPGNKVTWTLNSVHTTRLALDIAPCHCKNKDDVTTMCDNPTTRSEML